MSWDVFGSTLGMFSDRFGRVLIKSSENIEKYKSSDLSGSMFPASGCSKQLLLSGHWTKISENCKNRFCLFFYIFFYINSIGVGGMGGALFY